MTARIKIAFDDDGASIMQRQVHLPSSSASSSSIPQETNSTIIPEEKNNSARLNDTSAALHQFVVQARLDGFANFDDFYEIKETAEFALQGSYTRVALQMPDYLLPDGPQLIRRLRFYSQERTDLDQLHFFILGDTSYGACCVDEVAAKHLGADSVVHYGHTCLQPTASLPVKYVFGRLPLNTRACAKTMVAKVHDVRRRKTGEEGVGVRVVLVLHDVAYSHHMSALKDCVLQEQRKTREEGQEEGEESVTWLIAETNMRREYLPVGADSAAAHDRQHNGKTAPKVGAGVVEESKDDAEDEGTVLVCYAGQYVRVAEPREDMTQEWCVVFVGSAGTRMTRVAMRYGSIASTFLTYNPLHTSNAPTSGASGAGGAGGALSLVPSSTPTAMLTKRYWSVQRARDASIIGIIVGTMAGTSTSLLNARA